MIYNYLIIYKTDIKVLLIDILFGYGYNFNKNISLNIEVSSSYINLVFGEYRYEEIYGENLKKEKILENGVEKIIFFPILKFNFLIINNIGINIGLTYRFLLPNCQVLRFGLEANSQDPNQAIIQYNADGIIVP